MKTVNERQLAVLRWISDGCPDGVMTDDTYKTTAAALKSRRLAKVAKKGGRWSAQVTEAGRYFLAEGRYPDGHWEEPNKPLNPYQRAAQRPVTGLPPVEQLIADVQAAGGRMRVETGQFDAVQNLVTSAVRFGKVPTGFTMRIESGRSWSERWVVLVPLPEWIPGDLVPVPVAESPRRLHRVVASIKADKSLLAFARPVRSRALALLDALCREAERRGYDVQQADARDERSIVRITLHGQSIGIALIEQSDRVPHVPTAKELRDKERNPWKRIPEHDHVPSGRLTLQVVDGPTVHQEKFGDSKRGRLEDGLAKALFEGELRAAHLEERRITRERAEAERKERWQRTYDRAIEQARVQYRLQVLESQEERWRWQQRMTAYLDVLEAEAATLDEEARSAATEWVTWARDNVRLQGPLMGPIQMPDDPEFTADMLKPFMEGFPAHAPNPWD